MLAACGSDNSRRQSTTTAGGAATTAAATTTAAGGHHHRRRRRHDGPAAPPRPPAARRRAASNLQKPGQCGAGTGQKATGDPIKLGGIATNVPGIDFTWITGMTKAYFDCVNDNGGINGRPIQYIAETEQVDPQQIAALATKLIEQDKVLGLVGNTSIIDCSVNKDYYAKQGFYLIIAGVDQACFTSPNYSAVNMGPYYSSLGGAQAAVRARAPRASSSSCSPNQPGFDVINSGVVDFAKQNGMEGISILEDVPINDPAGLAQKLVQEAGDGGGVVLDFTGPTVVPLLQAIEQQGLDRQGDLGQLHAAQRPVGGQGAELGVERQVPHQRRVQRARLGQARPEPHERDPPEVRVRHPELELRPDGLPGRPGRHRRAAWASRATSPRTA